MRLYRVTGEVALSASTLTYLAQIATASGVPGLLTALDVTFDGVYSSQLPLIEFTKDAGVATGSSFTPLKWNAAAVASGTGAKASALTVITTAGTTPVTQSSWRGVGFMDKYPLGREPFLDDGLWYSLRVNSPVACNVSFNIEFEE